MSEEERETLIAELKKLPGVGSGRAGNLYDAGYKTLEDIKNASIDDLVKVPRITPTCAKAIKDYVAKKETSGREAAGARGAVEQTEPTPQEPLQREEKVEPVTEPVEFKPEVPKTDVAPQLEVKERKEEEAKSGITPTVQKPPVEIVEKKTEVQVQPASQSAMIAPEPRRARGGGKIALITIGVVLILVFAALALFFKAPPPEKSNVAIDGNFDDWLTIPKYTDSPNSAIPKDIDIIAYAADLYGGRLSLYAQVRGTMMGSVTSSGANVTEIFIDSDASESTGYRIRGIGAEYRIAIRGWNSNIDSADVWKYAGTKDQRSWTAWGGYTTSLHYAASSSQLEVQVVSDDFDIVDDYRLLFYAGDSNGFKDLSEVNIGKSPGALLVTQSPSADIINPTTSQKVAKVEYKAKGKDISASGISFKSSGPAVSYQHNVLVADGETKSIDVSVDASGLAQSTAVKVWVEKAGDVSAECGAVTVAGTGGNAYVTALPQKIAIDGLFDDWTSVQAHLDSDAVPIKDKNIDIDMYKTSNNCEVASTVAFYLKVTSQGTVMEGTSVPGAPSRQKTGGGLIQQINGQDIAKVYIDSDNNLGTGYAHGGIGADYKIEVVGTEGKVSSSNYYQFSGTSSVDNKWLLKAAVPSANGDRELETSISKAAIGNPVQTKLYFEMSNWANEVDGVGTAVIPDPIILTDTGHVYSSLTGAGYDATELLPGLSQTGKTFVDLTYSTAVAGTYYALANDGTAYETTDGGYNWVQVVEPLGTPTTAFRAIATDSAGYLYATTAEVTGGGGAGRSFYNDGTGTTWSQGDQSIIGYNNNVLADMTYFSGTGLSATLCGMLTENAAYLRYTLNGGQNWDRVQNGISGNGENRAITSIGQALYVLQSNGEVRTSTFSTTNIDWSAIPGGNVPGQNPVDIVSTNVGGNDYLLVVCADGHTYAYDFASTQWVDPGAPGTISGTACAIIPPAIPEFSALIVPVVSIVGLLVIVRTLRSKKRED